MEEKPVKIGIMVDPQTRQMSTSEKNSLKLNIGKLNNAQKKGIVDIVKKCVGRNDKNQSCFEFELDQLSTECLRELEGYVNKNCKDNQKKEKRKENDQKRRQKQQAEKNQQKIVQQQNPA